MDTISHGLWVFGGCKLFKYCRKMNIYLLTLFSMVPDIVAFLPIILYIIYLLITFQFPFSDPLRFSLAVGDKSILVVKIASSLYLITHSYITWIILFIALRKKEIIGGMIHITIDIFTHSLDFNPTRFLWPLSNYAFNGIKWSNPYFLLINFTSLLALYYYLWKSNKLQKEIKKIYKGLSKYIK